MTEEEKAEVEKAENRARRKRNAMALFAELAELRKKAIEWTPASGLSPLSPWRFVIKAARFAEGAHDPETEMILGTAIMLLLTAHCQALAPGCQCENCKAEREKTVA